MPSTESATIQERAGVALGRPSLTLARGSTDFDAPVDRRGTDSMKWGVPERFLSAREMAADPLPMWVADMDFRAPDAVVDALAEAVRHGVFGYPGGPRPSYLDAVIGWQRKRFGWDPAPDWCVPTGGVITAIKTVVQAFSRPGDSVLIQPPVYAHFIDDVVLNGRRTANAPLAFDGGRYRFDPAVFEAAIRDDTRIFLLSNPHNPTGNAWSADELRAMGEICARRDVLVVSDEIHEDFVLDRTRRHVPFGTLGADFARDSITLTSASKTFNLAGLQCANVFVPDARVRDAFRRQLDRNLNAEVNIFGTVATEAAYLHGEPWLEQLVDYVAGNHALLRDRLRAGGSRIRIVDADALYLAWMDCRPLGMDPEDLRSFMLTEARLWLDDGRKFGPQGHGFMRINLACARGQVEEAVSRLLQAEAKLDPRT